MRHVATLLALALALAPPAASAQATLGSLTGVVRDSQEAVLPGAAVTLTNTGTGTTQSLVTNEIGAYTFPQLPFGTYTVTVALTGFKTQTYDAVVINVGREYTLPVQLAVGAIEETVSVVAGTSLLSTTPEVSTTVFQQQVLDIPLANRDITNLIRLQAGVQGISNRRETGINGGRPGWTQVTLDGINIQDNFIRVNSLDFLPNRPTSDSVAEFSITTSVLGADAAGGASAVRMVTPAGTNTFHGSVYEFGRNSKFAANSFFNNASGVDKPKLRRNQFGGRLGGPLAQNRLFFFGYYEGFRQKTATAQNVTVPASADFLDGVFRYVGLDGAVHAVNVMQLSGLPIDQKLRADFLSKLPAASNVNNFDVGNSAAGRLLNTAGYRFNQNDLNNRDQLSLRFDYQFSNRHKFEGVFSYYKDSDDRTDIDTISPDRPLVVVTSKAKHFVGAWRSTYGTTLVNEARIGGNLSPVAFESLWDHTSGVLYNTVLGLTNPVGGFVSGGLPAASFQSQGRFTNTYQASDNATLLRDNHALQMGGSWQRHRVNPYNYAGQFPVVTFGFSAAAPATVQLVASMFPGGISATDLNNANLTAALLGGVVSSVAQTFQVKDAASGYVAGIPSSEQYTLDDIALYMQDSWRWKPNFTVRAGLKWEYYSPLREDNNLGFLPIADGRSIDQIMLDPNARITFVDGGYYNKDLNNFGPTVGFGWNLTDKTTVRGGYSLTFVNEESVTVGRAAARGNAGLSTAVSLSNQYKTVASGVPLPATPTFLTTRTLADQLALSATGIYWGIDPSINAPEVHQVSFGVQREIGFQTAVEARYVGTFGHGLWRGIDYNQIKMSSEFLADFNRARSNGFLSQAAGLGFVPTFNPNVAGSQALSVLPTFGLLTNATVLNSLQTNQVGALADFYISSRVPGALSTFMPNPGIYAAQAIVNGSFSDYNAVQLEARRRFSNGFLGQLNYTWAHTKTDSAGQAQNRFEAFMDSLRPELGTGRSVFQQTHVINANAVYELPFGRGRRWPSGNHVVNGIIGNWQLGSIVVWQSGSPLSIYSGRATFNRAGRSNCLGDTPMACNTAFTSLSAQDIRQLLGIYKMPDGRIYWIDPKVIDPATGRAVGADNLTNSAGFNGQVFFNPVGGEVGNLEVLTFDGPPQFRLDLAIAKGVGLPGRYRLELKGEAFNLFNQPSFFRGDMDINSATFGRLTSVNVGARVVQLSARLEF
jgi:carboxypeptidase family protein/TonB-dependent receptor-like protein